MGRYSGARAFDITISEFGTKAMTIEREQYQQVAIAAGVLAVIVAIMSGRLPRWLRITLVLSLLALAGGAGLFAYRYVTHPTTLTIAAGSLDEDVPRVMSAMAARMASTESPVRLKVIKTPTELDAAKEFADGKADLAVARADTVDLSIARAVLTVAHGVVLIVVPPGGSFESMDDLKGKTVGVVAGDINHKVVAAITKQYSLDAANVRFMDLTPAEVPQALQAKQVQALLVVMLISEKYLAMLRNVFPRNANATLGLVPLEAAGAIEAVAPPYKSYDLPKGTISGSPPVPDDDLTTLRVPFFLVANKKLDDGVVGGLAKAMMEARRELVGQYPLLAQVSEPDTDKGEFVPIHPGAAAYFDGGQKTIFDKYGDQFLYGSMLLGALMSVLAAVWKFMTKNTEGVSQPPTMQLFALMDKINEARSKAELAKIERQIDEILKGELEKYPSGNGDNGEMSALSLVSRRLEYLLAQRRMVLNGGSGALVQA
jgi:TRAP transporter TAXI family solute receptor